MIFTRARGVFDRHNTRANIGGFPCISYAEMLCVLLATSAIREEPVRDYAPASASDSVPACGFPSRVLPGAKRGEGGIRTLGSLLGYGALAKRCFRPLSHLTKKPGVRISRRIWVFQFPICGWRHRLRRVLAISSELPTSAFYSVATGLDKHGGVRPECRRQSWTHESFRSWSAMRLRIAFCTLRS